ncbi:hypothetical protein [Streptomyces boninensis]|uniref:hypothetical protein n=1 Tax=Streptomyces boninensis TaxID=2039455 RepID=UPI003B21FA8B
MERISVGIDGAQADGDSAHASIATDGSRIAFSSKATSLGSGIASTDDKVYVRDQRARLTRHMGSIGAYLQPPVISGDGQYAAFAGLIQRDTTNFLSRAGIGDTIGIVHSGHSADQPSLSADGSYIAQVGKFTRPLGVNRQVIEVVDWHTNTKETVAEFEHRLEARPSISGDGEYVAYQDAQAHDVWLWNRTDGTTSDPIEGQGKEASLVQLSDDGRKVVYVSGSDTHVYDVAADTEQVVPNVRGLAIDPTGRYLLHAPAGTTGPAPLALRDLRSGTDEVVSSGPATAVVDSVSAGGRDVAFASAADDIVPGDTNGKADIFVRRFF